MYYFMLSSKDYKEFQANVNKKAQINNGSTTSSTYLYFLFLLF